MSERPALVFISGFGQRVTPARAPYRIVRVVGSRAIEVTCQHADGWRSVRLETIDDELVSCLGEHTVTLSEVAEVAPGPSLDAWWVETSLYRLPLPESWTLHASGDDSSDAAPFQLLGPPDCTVHVQTPRRMPSLHKLQAPGQTFRDTGQLDRAAWLEFEYTQHGRAWVQRYELFHRELTAFAVTLHAPAEQVAVCMDALVGIVEGLTLGASAAPPSGFSQR